MPEHRSLYGDTNRIEWRDATNFAEEIERAAAIRQHHAALALNQAIDAGITTAATPTTHETRETLSRRFGYSEDYLGRTLRGERWASVTDLAQWALAARNPDILSGGDTAATVGRELVSSGWELPDDPATSPGDRGSRLR